MSQNLQIGIVGTGIFATNNHLPTLQGLNEEFTPVAAFNRTKEKALQFAQKANIPEENVHDSLESIMADDNVDVLDILLPVQYNLDALQKAVADGKPAIIEKPIAATIEDARAIVKLDQSTDIPIIIAENWLYLKVGQIIVEQLPKIGSVVGFTYHYTGPFNTNNVFMNTSWRLKPEHIGGYLSDGGVHQLALLTKVLGPIASVSALTKQVRETSGSDDILFSTMRTESEVIGTFTYGSAFGATEKHGSFTIYGDNGSIVADFSAGLPSSKVTVNTGSSAQEARVDSIIEYKENGSFGLEDEFKNLHEAVVKKDKSLVVSKPETAFHHLAIVAAALESSKKGGDSVKVQKP
jgi:predicted dehydrogenase